MAFFYDALLAPFAEFAFMQRALAGAVMLSLSACPVGVFLMLRRMSLTGDAMAHAILPGAAAGFLLYGLQILPMTIGGLAAGIVVALGAGAVARLTIQKEDASMAAFYLISLSLGVLMVSLRGSSVDLMHVLFGTVLALNNDALTLIGLVAALTLGTLGIFWRALVAECLDPLFLRSVSRLGSPVHFIFLGLVVINLVAGFQALGTLLSVGLMILPAAAARFWTQRVEIDVPAGDRARDAVVGFRAAPFLSCLAAFGTGDHSLRRRGLSRVGARRRAGGAAQPSPTHGASHCLTSKGYRNDKNETDRNCRQPRRCSLRTGAACSCRDGETLRRRHLFHHRRLRANCRRRPDRTQDIGRPQQRRPCLRAEAG
ncbi:MAG: metal ABC transporter permease [Chitinophagaceae bacterium]|nr:metal ABC transporter permease [Chitinophagaceae bacterium]